MTFRLMPEALEYILTAKKAMERTEPYLRISIKSEGGCCGPLYDIHFTDAKTENDFVFGYTGFTVLIDKKFAEAMNCAEMTTVKLGIETRLKIANPNFVKCSCHPSPQKTE